MIDKSQAHAALSERLADTGLIERALARAVRDALLRHKLAGNPIAIGQDGRVVWISPEDIRVATEG